MKGTNPSNTLFDASGFLKSIDKKIGKIGARLKKASPEAYSALKKIEDGLALLFFPWREMAWGMLGYQKAKRIPLIAKYITKSGSLPDYIIIGCPKCGTTSLQRYLGQHPDIVPSLIKEVNYFSKHCFPKKMKSLRWYKSFFPSERTKRNKITGEASPDYFADEEAPSKIKKFVPGAKLILLFRNPIDRAYSHYQMNRRCERMSEDVSLDHVVANKMRERENEKPALGHIIKKSLYSNHINNWLDVFGREKILIIKSEDFFSDLRKTLSRVFGFLGVADHAIRDPKAVNVGAYHEKMSPQTRKLLAEYFKPYNEKLYSILGEDFGWE